MGKVNDAIRFTENIQTSFKKMKVITVTTVVAAVVAVIGVSVTAFSFAADALSRFDEDKIYLLDEGSVLSAYRVDNMAQRDLEAINQVTRFHELFFNVAPNNETINRNTNAALALSDNSAYAYFNDLKEQEFFTRLIQNNAMQQVNVDSVKVDMSVYPYKAHSYVSRYYIRPTNITKYAMQTTCLLAESPRSESNPHGLTIQRFTVISDREVETRARR